MASSSSSSSLTHAPGLPQLKRLITSHNDKKEAVLHSTSRFSWELMDQDRMAFSVVYSTSEFPPNLNGEADIAAYKAHMARGTGLVNPGGTIIRCVDLAPGYQCGMHRTQSLDYGIVLEGAIDMVLDSGEVHHMNRGDVAVQRATNHQWRNMSDTQWARMMFVLQDCQPLVLDGKTLEEDLGKDLAFLPPSNN